MEVISYYDENPEKTTKCQINPEKKFCCDLSEIKEISYKPGKKVIAEVFDNETKYVADPVYLETSSEGYDLEFIIK